MSDGLVLALLALFLLPTDMKEPALELWLCKLAGTELIELNELF